MWVTPNARARAKMKGRQFSNNYDNSVITGPITLKLRMQEGIHLAMYFHASQLGMLLHVRTCKGRSQITRTAEPIALKFGTAMGTG